MAGLTRGSLPPGVYWRRRLFALGLVAAMVMLGGGLIRGLTGDADPSDGAAAEQAAAEPTTSPSTTPSEEPTTGSGSKSQDQGPGSGVKSNKTPLAVPEGRCASSDIVAEPKVGESVAGRDVAVILKLSTEESEACTFSLSARSLTLKITSGSDEIWSSRHCQRTIPQESLVLRKEAATRIRLDWNAKRSDEGCSRLTQWALPGWYEVAAAALGGEPTSARFELETPRATEPEPSATPRPDTKRSGDASGDDASNQKKNPQNDENLHRTER
jgi:hypothetical protein